MIEFVNNCLQWLSQNYQITLTSIQFIPLVWTVILLIISRKRADKNDAVLGKLNDVFDEDDVRVVKVYEIVKLKQELNTVNAELVKLKEFETDALNALQNKVNAMLEVQSVVYSTIRNENMRSAVNNVIMNAKHAETPTRAKLKQEAEALRKNVEDTVNKVMEEVSKSAGIIESTVGLKDDTLLRY